MLKENRTNTIVLALTLIFAVNFILYGNYITKYDLQESGSSNYEKATVTKILTGDKYDTGDDSTFFFKAKLTTGDDKDSTVIMSQSTESIVNGVKVTPVQVGDKIIALKSSQTINGTEINWQYSGVNRLSILMLISIIFFLLIILIGRKKGLATIITLLLTVLVIFMVYIPSVLAGFNIYKSTLIISAFIIFTSLILLNGANKKTVCAIVGNLGGTISAAILATIFGSLLNITGVVNEESIQLSLLTGSVSVDLKGIVWASIVIGSLGAVMDVSMSLSSSMYELSNEMKEKSFSRLVNSGMAIGRDAIGTMANTLILAYVGGSFSLMVLMFAYNSDAVYLLNLESITVEIAKALIGSIGLLLAVPLTVLFSAWAYMRDDDEYEYYYVDENGNEIVSEDSETSDVAAE